ncbi:MAG: tripartite tricarboxylate transporter permease [Desulfitobacterium hafniense]|nr:tripartite tricarboxylate transporter permease [Desulfitobacterium hafniense]
MFDLDLFVQGLSIAMTLQNLVFMAIGSLLGIIFSAIPGLTFSTALILLLPLTFGLQPVAAISVLLGVFAGGMTGGSISATLLGIPGNPSAAATVIDGYMLTKKGQGGKALGMSIYSSVFGGIVSLLVLIAVAPLIAKVALKFGPAELFALVLFGLSTIVGLTEGSVIKGLIAGMIGLLISTVGMDPVMGLPRYTFGYAPLMSGIGIMPVMIGAFALPEIINTFLSAKKNKGINNKKEIMKVKASFPTLKEQKETFWLNMKSSLLGTLVGAVPGAGGPIAAFLAYNMAKRNNPKCGTGEIDGVAAPEASNNGVTGGAMITLLTLGIPADSAAAIILGGFLIHGIVPGPLLFKDNGPMVYAIFISMLIINLMVLVLQFGGMKLFIKVLDVPKLNLMTFILAVTIVGSFAMNLSFTDVLIMFVIGVISWFMKRYGFAVIPLILGLVLGGSIEDNFRKAMVLSDGSLSIFVSSPVSLVFILLALLVLLGPTLKPMVTRVFKANA